MYYLVWFLFTTTLCFREWLSQLIHEYSWWMASWLFSTSENYTQSGSGHSCLDLCLDFRFQLWDYWSNLVFSYEENATLIYTVYTCLDSHYRPSHCTFQLTRTIVSSMGISHSKKCAVSPCCLCLQFSTDTQCSQRFSNLWLCWDTKGCKILFTF